MSRGGSRQGAGRKAGVPNRINREIRTKAESEGEMPIDYMLRVMRDESADPERRDDMAKTVAPYLHGKSRRLTLWRTWILRRRGFSPE